MKTFFPDLPLNSGLYRVIEMVARPTPWSSAKWPVAVTGFLMPFEKIMNSIYEIWSGIMPHRAISCTFNIEYLLTGGNDARRPEKPIFMFYDWLPGGWGGRNGKDGANVTQASLWHRHAIAARRRSGARRADPHNRIRGRDGFGRSRQVARRGWRPQGVHPARG